MQALKTMEYVATVVSVVPFHEIVTLASSLPRMMVLVDLYFADLLDKSSIQYFTGFFVTEVKTKVFFFFFFF